VCDWVSVACSSTNWKLSFVGGDDVKRRIDVSEADVPAASGSTRSTSLPSLFWQTPQRHGVNEQTRKHNKRITHQSKLQSDVRDKHRNKGSSTKWLCWHSVCSTSMPSYLRLLIQDREHGRNLRSATTALCQPFTTTTFVKRAFWCSVPAVWNSLLKTVLSSDSVAVFKSKLKTFLFSQAFNSSSAH